MYLFKKSIVATTVMVIFSLLSAHSFAAFCSLRDPVETIKALHPESTSFKSIVKVIDENVRNQVQTLLPPNTLHFSELGKHTLYVVYTKDRPTGYVHVRSEESEWGLVEIAWSMTLDLEVKDFKLQRCRSRARKLVDTEDFKVQLRGRTYHDFVQMLNRDGYTLNTDKVDVDPKAKSLAEVIIRCGMKTLLVTELAWSQDVQKNTLYRGAELNFKAMDAVTLVDQPMDGAVSKALNSAFSGASTGIDRSTVAVAKVYDKQQQLLGAIYQGRLDIDGRPSIIEWAITAKGEIININNSKGWGNHSTQKAFEKTIGQNYSSTNQCNDRAELVALEAIVTTRSLLEN